MLMPKRFHCMILVKNVGVKKKIIFGLIISATHESKKKLLFCETSDHYLGFCLFVCLFVFLSELKRADHFIHFYTTRNSTEKKKTTFVCTKDTQKAEVSHILSN